jgi:chromosome segregation ATPase
MSLSNEIDQMRRNAEDDAAALSTANSEIERLKAEMAKSARDTEQARTVRDIFSDSLQRIRKENADLSFKLEQIVKVMDEREGTPSYLAALETENARLCEDNVRLNAKVGIGVTVGGGHIVYGSHEAIKRVQHIIMIDSTHPIEKEDVRRSLLRQVQAAEARITSLKRELETLRGTALSEADKSLGVLEDECEQNRMSFVQTRNSESAQLALFERNILKRARSIVRSLMEVDAPIPNTPSQQLVRHKKRGSTYHVIGRGELQSVFPIEQGTPLVAYQGEADGRVWIRPAVEFDDGRFEKIEVRDV